jgi:hypothetical protein
VEDELQAPDEALTLARRLSEAAKQEGRRVVVTFSGHVAEPSDAFGCICVSGDDSARQLRASKRQRRAVLSGFGR